MSWNFFGKGLDENYKCTKVYIFILHFLKFVKKNAFYLYFSTMLTL